MLKQSLQFFKDWGCHLLVSRQPLSQFILISMPDGELWVLLFLISIRKVWLSICPHCSGWWWLVWFGPNYVCSLWLWKKCFEISLAQGTNIIHSSFHRDYSWLLRHHSYWNGCWTCFCVLMYRSDQWVFYDTKFIYILHYSHYLKVLENGSVQ